MAVKFEFTLEDADAENLFGCTTSILISKNRLGKAIVENDEQMQQACLRDVEYFQSLKSKLLNTRVGE